MRSVWRFVWLVILAVLLVGLVPGKGAWAEDSGISAGGRTEQLTQKEQNTNGIARIAAGKEIQEGDLPAGESNQLLMMVSIPIALGVFVAFLYLASKKGGG